jgi:alpha-tubulin suppressor-like RCC1 family protein
MLGVTRGMIFISGSAPAAFSPMAMFGQGFGVYLDSGTKSLWGWGQNTSGQLGNGDTGTVYEPVSNIESVSWKYVASGVNYTLAIKSDDTCWSWGSGSQGVLGNNSTANQSSPVSVLGDNLFTKVAGGSFASFALKSDGSMWAWGRNQGGQLCDGTIVAKSSPISAAITDRFVDISAGNNYCHAGLKSDGSVWCWGSGTNGQIGDGTATGKSSPVSVLGGNSFTKVSFGSNFCLALKADGTVFSWGANTFGQLGTGDQLAYSSPVSVVTTLSFKDIAGGNSVSYGLDSDGYAWSWGSNTYGELGDNNSGTSVSSPVSVVGDHVFVSIFSDSAASMGGGIKSDGSVWVWGRNNYGQLGIGNTDNQSSPVSVHNLPAAKAWRLTKGFEVNVLPGTDGGCSGIEAYTQGDNILTVLQDMTLGTVYMKLYDSSGNIYATNTGVGMIFPYSLTLNTIKSTNWTRWNGEVNVVQYSKWNTTDATAIVDWTYIDGSVWDWGKNQPLWYTGTQLNNENWAFITVERAGEGSPITALNYYITNCDATTVVDQTTLTSEVYSDYFVGHTDVYMCDTDDGGFAVLYRVNDGTNTITYNLYIRDSSGAEVVTLTGIEVTQIDGRNIFNVGGRLWVCFWDGPVTSPDSGYIRIYEYDGTLTKEITLDAGFVGNNGYIGKPGYFDTTPNAVVLFGCGGKYKLYNNSDLTLYSSGTLKVNSITPNFSGKCLTRDDGNVVWVPEMQGPNYPEWYLVELSTEYKY